MTVEPGEHARRVIVLLSGRAAVYEPGPRGRGLTLSVAEAGTVVGVAGLSGRARGLPSRGPSGRRRRPCSR
jgi:CRP-like cAMP-binding protein